MDDDDDDPLDMIQVRSSHSSPPKPSPKKRGSPSPGVVPARTRRMATLPMPIAPSSPPPQAEFTTGYVYDERMLLHKETDEHWDEHPEAPARISVTFERLRQGGLISRMKKVPVKEVGWPEVSLVHTKELWNQVQGFAKFSELDIFRTVEYYKSVSLYVVPETPLCARLSCGGVIETALAVMNPASSIRNAFAIVRPPGHHSEPGKSQGFCFFNNVAVAARVVQEKYGKIRTVILDWDVHHGNGTQRAFYDDDSILYISLHRYDNAVFYPGGPEGNLDWVGEGKGEGKNVNIPWNGIMGDSDYVVAFDRVVMPILREFAPEIIFGNVLVGFKVSAGFDAARGDPLGGFDVTPAGYATLLSLLCTLANGKVIVALEGGYEPEAVAECAAACTKTLLGDPPPILSKIQPSRSAEQTIYEVIQVQSKYWNLLPTAFSPPKEDYEHIQSSIVDMPKILAAYRKEQLSNRYEMVPLPLSQPQLNEVYDGLVYTTTNVYKPLDTLVLFIHDIGNLTVKDSGPNKDVELPSSYLIDCSNQIIDWVVDSTDQGLGQGGDCGIIDISLPLQYPVSLQYGMAYSSPKVAKQSYQSLLQHIWNTVVDIGRVQKVVMIGHGTGCTAINLLISSSTVEEKTKAVVQVYGMNEVLKLADHGNKNAWYADCSYRVAPHNHPFFDLSKKAANRIGKVNRSDETRPVMVLHKALKDIQTFVSNKIHVF